MPRKHTYASLKPEIKKAVTVLEESAFTEAQLLGYEKFWDIISVEKTLYNSAERKGLATGMAKGLEEGREEEKLTVARQMKTDCLPVNAIAKYTGLSTEEIEKL